MVRESHARRTTIEVNDVPTRRLAQTAQRRPPAAGGSPWPSWSARWGHELTVEAAREALDAARQAILGGETCPPAEALARDVADRLAARLRPTLRPAINATGVIVHTNLGRAPLSAEARAAMDAVAAGYTNLEYDLAAGQRGSRYVHAEELLCRLTGAEAALVVNNNAAAVLLILMCSPSDREVIISRGQLVEIGGGFRIPDVMRQSGATLVEVGTTNRTYVRDYEAAIGENTAALMRVHRSNFRLLGFIHEPALAELVELADEHGLLLFDDLGSGTLLDTAPYGLAHEPTVQESVAAGASLVSFSGDKLLGGPQAGLILGKADLIARLHKFPLTRALRVDKTTLAGAAGHAAPLPAGRGHGQSTGVAHDRPGRSGPEPARPAVGAQAEGTGRERRGRARPVDRGRRQPARRDAAHAPGGPRRRLTRRRGRPAARRRAAGHRPHRGRPPGARSAHRAAGAGGEAASTGCGSNASVTHTHYPIPRSVRDYGIRCNAPVQSSSRGAVYMATMFSSGVSAWR